MNFRVRPARGDDFALRAARAEAHRHEDAVGGLHAVGQAVLLEIVTTWLMRRLPSRNRAA